MAPRKPNQPASWELDADKQKPEGETRVRRSYAVKELITCEFVEFGRQGKGCWFGVWDWGRGWEWLRGSRESISSYVGRALKE